MTVEAFVAELSSVTLPNVFNPYRDVCDFFDHSASPAIRRRNLTLFLGSIAKAPKCSLWLGRDLGYRGGRRTGIALTDEVHLELLQETFRISGIAKATVEPSAKKERTATEVWKLLRRLNEPVLLWNAFPFHPYEKNDPLSNRRHTALEFASCRHLLTNLIEWLQPTTIVALGADAEAAVFNIGQQCHRVRHPSYGGQTDFARQVAQIYGC